MRLFDIVSAPWAVTPEMFSEVQAIYSRHVRGDKIDLKDIEARVGAPLNNARRDLQVINGVAVIPVEGVLAKRMNLLMQISGGMSMLMVGNMVRAAAEDDSVKSIILHIDSPGGTVDGTQELANIVASARARKPVIALADGVMASAAYWIGSAAEKVFISSDTTIVGSIGIVATHIDVSGREAQMGVKTTEITAGKYKRIASQYGALTPEGRADIQEKADYFYSVFVEAVAENRGVGVENVLERMADGKTFIGQQAIDAGLVDGVATLDELIARAAAGEFTAAQPNKVASGAGVAQTETIEESKMDLVKLKAEHPDLYAAVVAEGHAAGLTAGAEAERARIQAVEAQALPGHEQLIATLKFDGKTTGEQAAVQVLNAERGKTAAKLQALRNDGAEAGKVPASGADLTKADPKKPSADAPVDERAKYAWENDAAARTEFGGSYERFLAYFKASDAGLARIKAVA
jgi:capsid assembly protease